MRSLRISAISFLNTAPLMWDFEHKPSPELSKSFEIQYTVPSACANALREGTADIGIIPVITYAGIPDLVIVPDVAIAARGPVRSILLVTNKPLGDVETVAVDTSSRTSVALTQVLLTNWFGGKRRLMPMEPQLATMLAYCDAALIIGDPALTLKANGYQVYDLAKVWHEKTGRPFVFAFWAVRRQALAEMRPGLPVATIFQRSRDHGLEDQSITTMAQEWAGRLALSPDAIESYLRDNIYYYLDAPCIDGMKLYFELAAACDMIKRVPKLEFLK